MNHVNPFVLLTTSWIVFVGLVPSETAAQFQRVDKWKFAKEAPRHEDYTGKWVDSSVPGTTQTVVQTDFSDHWRFVKGAPASRR